MLLRKQVKFSTVRIHSMLRLWGEIEKTDEKEATRLKAAKMVLMEIG